MSQRDPKIYCINLKSRPDRKTRIEKRFLYHDLKNVEFVEAISKNSPIIDYYGEKIWHNEYPLDQQRGEVACFASHLKAIRRILEDTNSNYSGGIICEDDALLRNDFQEKLKKIFQNIPEDTSLICLGYYVEYWIDFKWAGINPNYENLCFINSDHVWATTMYWISKQYAYNVLKTYDLQFHNFNGHKTAELITRFSNGFIAYPPLCIEDCIGSDIRSKKDMDLHIRVSEGWGYNNYSNSESIHESPLYEGKSNMEEIAKIIINDIVNSIQKPNSLNNDNLSIQKKENKSALEEMISSEYIYNEDEINKETISYILS